MNSHLLTNLMRIHLIKELENVEEADQKAPKIKRKLYMIILKINLIFMPSSEICFKTEAKKKLKKSWIVRKRKMWRSNNKQTIRIKIKPERKEDHLEQRIEDQKNQIVRKMWLLNYLQESKTENIHNVVANVRIEKERENSLKENKFQSAA